MEKKEEIGRRGYIKYVGAGIVAVAVAGGAGYYAYQSKQIEERKAGHFAGTEITFMTPDPPATEVLIQADDLEKKHGIKVKVIKTSLADHNEKMMMELTSHAGNVDVMEQMVEHVGMNYKYYVPMEEKVKEWGINLDDYIEFALQASGYFDEEHKFSPRGGGSVLYNIPNCATIDLYTYRKDWFEDPDEQAAFKERYGYDLTPPEDGYAMKEFCDVLEFFTRPEEGIYGLAEAADPREAVVTTRPEAFSRGIYYTDAKGVPAFNNPGNVEALALHQYWYKQGWVVPGSTTITGDILADELLRGHCAMCLIWIHMSGPFESEDSPLKGKVGYMVPPSWKEWRGKSRPLPPGVTSWVVPGSTYRAPSGGWNLGVNKDSKHIDEAFVFVKWFTSHEVQKKGSLATGFIGATKSVYDDPEIQEKFPYTKVARKCWSPEHSWTCIPRVPEMGEMYAATTHLIQEALSKLRDPKEVLDECQEAVVKIWKKAGYPTEGEYAPW
jgi:multiple sugar transport system substrate-binding protein